MLKMLLAVLAGLVFATSFANAGPNIINYQGTLFNKDGSKANGSVNMVFSAYSSATGSSPLWTETWSAAATPSNPVIVTNGSFNVMLGAVNPFPTSFFSEHQNTYLGIKIGTDSEMLPRQQFASVGYAFSAVNALSAVNGVPKGGVIMWSGAVTAIPDGWALCDGTNGTPDLKDRFIVGAGKGYVTGATGGETAHILTIGEMPNHNHSGATGNDSPDHIHYDAGHTHIQNKFDSSGGVTQVGGGSGSGTNITNTSTQPGFASIGGASTRHTHMISAEGGGAPHNNLPPYYALAFIMKL
ncbi:hypothetical protein [Geomonas ferrireducens]|uniref:hypothetical protein n=1 Tax=Geomonas ferrireducens TaxID=2570227 RepID=UPI0010A8B622|nr:hypothetical protein [Geomonas ferrireducens]